MSSQVTLKQIAESLDISAMTVSRALNDSSNVDENTKQRVLEKAQSMGYTPNHVAKSLVSRKTFTIGVLIPKISHSFFPEVVRGIEEVTTKFKYQLFLSNANERYEREKQEINALRSKRVDGILISSSLTTDDYSYYEEIIKNGTKVVFFDRCIENIGASSVRVNDRIGSKQITNHLIEEHGYTKIAYLSGSQVTIGKERYQGYLDALREHNLPLREKWIIEAGFREKAGYRAMNAILEMPAHEYPEAVVSVNDPCAFGAIKAIKKVGLSIPEDLAIVGFADDIRSQMLETPLTTVYQPAYAVGKKAAKKLIRTIEDEDEPNENIEVLTTLKIRKSCGCDG